MKDLKSLTWCGIGMVVLVTAGFGHAEATTEDLLKSLVPAPEDVERMHVLAKELGADDFKTREAAMKALGAYPAIDPAVIARAMEAGEPEVIGRIRKLQAASAVDRREAILIEALGRIVEHGEVGHLERLRGALEAGVQCGDPGLLERAAMRTAREGEAEAVATLAASDKILLRRLAAGAASALGEKGGPIARDLLKDKDRAVALRAAIALGNLGEIEGAQALGEFLSSEDVVERVRAWKALRGLTGQDLKFSPLASAESRKGGQARWEAWLRGPNGKITGKALEASWRRLFNGKDLAGWTAFRAGVEVAPAQSDWNVEGGVLHCPGKGPGDLRTKEAFDNYILTLKFRAPQARSDSGIGVMLGEKKVNPAGFRRDGGSYLEIQLLPGRSGDLYVIGGFKAQAGGANIAFSHPRHADVGDDPEMWHEARVEVANGTATIFINGTEVNKAEDGPKGPGKILLREETASFEFREITLLSLDAE